MRNHYRIILPSLLLLLCACQREALPETSPAAEDGVLIPIRLEGAMGEGARTRMSLDAGTGVFNWDEGDAVSVCLNRAGTDRYVKASIKGEFVRLDMTDLDTRTNYAVYPSSGATSNLTAPTVTYPASYNLRQREADTYAPVPMVADNTRDELVFYHVGGLLRIDLKNVPSGTTGFVVTFTGMSRVTGTYTVSDAGTAQALTAWSSGGGSTVTFTNVTTASQMSLNIPLPSQDYSALTRISVATTGLSVNYTTTLDVTGWGTLGHGRGREVEMDFDGCVTHLSGYTGAFRGIYISKGVLVKENGVYSLTSGDDPLELVGQFGNSSAIGVYYHRFATLRTDLGMDDDDIDADSPYLPEGWCIPTRDQYLAIINGDVVNSTFNGVENRWSTVAVNLDGSAYAGKGFGDSGTLSIYGTLFFPDNSSIICRNIIGEGGTLVGYPGKISAKTLKRLVDGGCAFFPAAGNEYWITGGYYWSATCAPELDSYPGQYLSIGWGGPSVRGMSIGPGFNVRLVHE